MSVEHTVPLLTFPRPHYSRCYLGRSQRLQLALWRCLPVICMPAPYTNTPRSQNYLSLVILPDGVIRSFKCRTYRRRLRYHQSLLIGVMVY